MLCRFDGLSTLLKSQSGLHGTAGPGGRRPSIKGLYMYGGVGCGKTMLMDLLVAAAPREFQVRVPVRR
jgi:predicted ATPase